MRCELSSSVYISTYSGAQPSFVKITYYDNQEGFFVGENSGPGSYNPGKWSRVDWVRDPSDKVHICYAHYDATDEAAAMLPNPSHDHALYLTTGCAGSPFSALTAGSLSSAVCTDGCGGFAFSTLTRPPKGKLAIAGSYTDPWNTAIELSSSVYISTVSGAQPSFVKISYMGH